MENIEYIGYEDRKTIPPKTEILMCRAYDVFKVRILYTNAKSITCEVFEVNGKKVSPPTKRRFDFYTTMLRLKNPM